MAVRNKALDTLKLLFCLIIFSTHYMGAFWLLCDPRPSHVLLNHLLTPPFTLLFDSSLTLYGFFLISGMLASRKKITSGRALLQASVLRYFRFLIPFFFINTLCFALYYTGAFRTTAVAATLNNQWVASYYNHAPTISEYLRATLLLDGALDGPLWMMKYLFFGTVLVYVYSFLRDRFFSSTTASNNVSTVAESIVRQNHDVTTDPSHDGLQLRAILYDVAVLVLYFVTLYYVPRFDPNAYQMHIVLAGIPLMQLKIRMDQSANASVRSILATLLVFLSLYLECAGQNHFIYPIVNRLLPEISSYFIWNRFWCCLFSAMLILGSLESKPVTALLSWKPIAALSDLSFPVYLLHWPLICSFSAAFTLFFLPRMSYARIFVLNAFLSLVLLILIAKLYASTFGKLEHLIFGSVKTFIS
ncbi:MAG: acyltransferase family protein [Oribacterium sp.]|nr:acyltransferase family protein [Oribacterium sp.]MDY6317212.1 acyltransferase family protein [Oribacterium sp.]